MSTKRMGNQLPTQALTLPYTMSSGTQAVELYNKSGRTAFPWQEQQIEDILATNDEGLWVHAKYGYAVPRRNGKSEILAIRAIFALSKGEKVLYTAHRTSTSHRMWELMCDLLEKIGFGDDLKTQKTKGAERIDMLCSDGIMHFRTRSSKGGLGEGYDLLIIDEAQEYTADQKTALQYLVTDSANPQTLMCGTPPTVVSSGDVFLKFRRDCLNANAHDSGWAEWSVPRLSAVDDVDLWYQTNPSLGYKLTERNIREEDSSDVTDFNIQRLGLWLTYSQKSAITRKEWELYTITEKPKRADNMTFFGVKYSKNTENVCLSVAVKTADNRVFVECVDCRPKREGTRWLVDFLRNPNCAGVCIDGAEGQGILANAMKDAGIKIKPEFPKVSDIINANSMFEEKLFQGLICHSEQPSVTQSVANCEHRAIGGGFGYSSILEGAEAAILESIALAHRICALSKPKKKQIVRCYD